MNCILLYLNEYVIVELRGFEPRSRERTEQLSTCLVSNLCVRMKGGKETTFFFLIPVLSRLLEGTTRITSLRF